MNLRFSIFKRIFSGSALFQRAETSQRAIEADIPGRRSHFEHKLADIVGALEGNYYVGEEFAEAYFNE